MYYLTLTAIFRDENSWLEEWIRYHRAIGVEHIYLFNHDRDTRVFDKILRPYVESGYVDNIHVLKTDWGKTCPPDRHQILAYQEVLKQVEKETYWLGIIDLDEFLLPKNTDDLRLLLVPYENYSALAINWQIFGTSGYIKRPQSQICHLLHRAQTYWKRNRFIKSIVRPGSVDLERIIDVHDFPMKSGITVNEKYEPVPDMWHDVSNEIVQINHYLLRSWQDFWEVKASRPRFNGVPACDEPYFHLHDQNEILDDEIARRFGDVIL